MATQTMLTPFNNLAHISQDHVHLLETYVNTIEALESIITDLQTELDYMSENSFKKVKALEKQIEDMKNTVPSSTKVFNWNDNCSVCLAQFKQGDELVITKCNHVFHESCLSQSLTVNSSCPLCRCEL